MAGVQINRGILLKTSREIGLMREAGRLVCNVHDQLAKRIAPGVTTAELNTLAEELIADAGGTALFKGVTAPKAKYPFPAALCTSVNDEVVHGIPGQRKLNSGDVISIDCGVRLNGYCGDAARTHAVGAVNRNTQKLLDTTSEMLMLAIDMMAPGRRWSQIAKKMQACAQQNGFSVVREFVGHGIGQQMHEEPKVPNYYDRYQAKHDFELLAGMVLAVEPMVNMGAPDVEYKDEDGWAVVTKDGKWAAHFEHTIAVTEKGSEILTINK